MKKKPFQIYMCSVALLSLFAGCSNNNSHLTEQASLPTDALEPIPTAEVQPTAVPTVTATATATATAIPSATPTSTPTPAPTVALDCDFDNYLEAVPTLCLGQRMTVAGVEVANSIDAGDRLSIKATKKNGGTGGSRWYDAKITLSSPIDVLLPQIISIQSGGNAGNGQKLYLTFDQNVICSYRSHAASKYINPICKLNGSIDPSTGDGFSVGVGTYQADSTRVNGLSSVHCHVNGANGSGLVTQVRFDLLID